MCFINCSFLHVTSCYPFSFATNAKFICTLYNSSFLFSSFSFLFYLTIVKTCVINVTSNQLIFKASGLFSVVLFDLSVAHKCFGFPLFHELTRSLEPQHTALSLRFLILFTVRSSAFLRLPVGFLVLPWLQLQLTSFVSQLSICSPYYSPDLARASSPSDFYGVLSSHLFWSPPLLGSYLHSWHFHLPGHPVFLLSHPFFILNTRSC